MSIMKSPTAFLGLVWLLSVSISNAQIDHRVNQGNTATGGYALDKNAQSGSGGFNLSRPGFDYGARSNAVITGNVTGLGGFHGNSPVLQNNQFRSSLPSAGLSGFQSRSIGAKELVPGQAPNQTFFFDPSKTIADLGQIRQGLNQPGSSRLSTTATPPQFPITPASPQRLPNPRDASESRLQLDVPPATLGLRPGSVVRAKRPEPRDSVAPSFRAAAGSSIFGAATPSGETGALPGVDFRLDQIQTGLTWDDLAKPEALRGFPAKPVADDGLGSLQRDGSQLAQGHSKAVAPATAAPAASTDLPPPIGALPLNGQAPANLGADRFADLYNAVRAADQLGIRQLGWEPSAAPPGLAQGEPTRTPTTGHSELFRKTSEGLNQLASAAKWAKDVLDDPVTTFVGKNESKFNDFMASGEEAMRQGDYYKAARLFDLARSVDVLNPLPNLHRGHALAAAGDYVSAVRSLEQGIRLFPHIAAFKLDLIAIVGQRDVFDVRRADLESRLSIRDQYELRFLLGYLELYSGLAEEGMKNLRVAAKLAPADSPISTFADLVGGQKALPGLPQ